jgi:hypothetical protein
MTVWHNEQKYHNDLQTPDLAVASSQVWCAYMQARIYRGCLLGVDMVKMIAILLGLGNQCQFHQSSGKYLGDFQPLVIADGCH